MKSLCLGIIAASSLEYYATQKKKNYQCLIHKKKKLKAYAYTY
jgi:hypothetical protein